MSPRVEPLAIFEAEEKQGINLRISQYQVLRHTYPFDQWAGQEVVDFDRIHAPCKLPEQNKRAGRTGRLPLTGGGIYGRPPEDVVLDFLCAVPSFLKIYS